MLYPMEWLTQKDIISSDILQIEKFTCMQLQWNVVLNRSITSINVLP
jgi:hypothetical protein